MKRNWMVHAVLVASLVAGAGVVLSPTIASAWASQPCTGVTGAVTISTDVVVPPGATCTLNATTVLGNVTVGAGSTLITQNGVHIGGGVAGSRAHRFVINETTVGGSVNFSKTSSGGENKNFICSSTIKKDVNIKDSDSGSTIVVGDLPADEECHGANTIWGTVVAAYNQSSVQLSDSHVGGTVLFWNNAKHSTNEENEFDLGGNTIGHNLACFGNIPAPEDASTSTVGGQRSGQCA